MTKRFDSADINACRDWLRASGMRLDGRNGWVGEGGAIGLLEYWRGYWHAAIAG